MLMEIDIKQLIKKSKAIQKIQEKTKEEYKIKNEEEFAKLYMKHIGKKVKFKLSQ